MKQALLSLIGQYIPSTIPLYNDAGEIVLYVSCPDFAWIMSCIFCIIFVYCFMKLLGGLLCKW